MATNSTIRRIRTSLALCQHLHRHWSSRLKFFGRTMPKTETKKEVMAKSKGSKFQWPKFKLPHRYVVYDKFHRGVVFTIISMSVIMLVRMGIDIVHNYKVRNPIMLEIARLEKESKMEDMQKEKEEALSLQKKLQEEANKV